MKVTMDRYAMMAILKDTQADDVKANTIKENEKENTCLLYMEVSLAKIQSRSLHSHHWCARSRTGDARSALITIFACSLLHDKIEHQTILLLGP